MTGVGRLPPIRNSAAAKYSVSGNGNFVPTPAFYLPLILVVTVLQETTQTRPSSQIPQMADNGKWTFDFKIRTGTIACCFVAPFYLSSEVKH
jgi:hypothetical protein